MHNLISEDVLLDFLQICWERQVVIWVHQNKQDPNMDYYSRLTMCRGALTVEATFIVPIFFLSVLQLFVSVSDFAGAEADSGTIGNGGRAI